MNNSFNENFMQQAIALAKEAAKQDEVPVGAVVAQDNKIIGRGYNQPIQRHDPSAHAEIIAIRSAGQYLNNYRLVNCQLYVTLEPCPMCAGAIIQARIQHVFFGATDPKGGAAGSKFNLLPADQRFNHQTTVTGGLLALDCSRLLTIFFKQKRRAHLKKKKLLD